MENEAEVALPAAETTTEEAHADTPAPAAEPVSGTFTQPAPETKPAATADAAPAPEAAPAQPAAPSHTIPATPTDFTGRLAITLPHLFTTNPADGSIASDSVRVTVIITRGGKQTCLANGTIVEKTEAPVNREWSFTMPPAANG